MKSEPEVLMVDDNPADVDLTREVLKRGKRRFHVNTVENGEEAMLFLRARENMPRRRARTSSCWT